MPSENPCRVWLMCRVVQGFPVSSRVKQPKLRNPHLSGLVETLHYPAPYTEGTAQACRSHATGQ
jgi:hypothetical protein